MNYLTKKLISSILAVGLVTIALSVMPTSAQAQNPERRSDIPSQTEISLQQPAIRPATVQAQINPALIKVNRRPPIQFKAFEILDPTNRKPISRDTMLPALPNGKRLTAGQYYDELNKLERQFNALGYTLKNSRGSKIELQTTPVPVTTLQRQAQVLRTAHLSNTQFQPLNLRDVEREYKATVVNPRAQIPIVVGRPGVILVPIPKTVHWVKDWNHSLEFPDVFSAYINGKIELNGTKDVTKVDGEVNAGGSMFGESFELLRVTGNLNAPKSGTMNVKVGVSVLEKSVHSLDENVTAAWSKTDSISVRLDKSVTIHFTLGPIPMSAKFGATGTAGINYGVAIAPLMASARVGPFVHTNVYAQAGVDLLIAEAGAGANLTLLNTDGNLNGSLSMEIDSASKPYFKWTDSYSQSLDMLGGNVYIFAKISYPCFCCWCTDEYNWNVFSWGGFHVSGELFNDSKTLYLF